MLVQVLACAALLAVAAAQPRPNIPSTFLAQIRVESYSPDATYFGDGFWASDFKNQRAVEDYKLEATGHVLPLYVYQLQRYDLGQIFEIDSENRELCRERDVNGTMPAPFAWVAQATYRGSDIFHHLSLDLWGATFGSVDVEVAVLRTTPNVPVFFRRRSTQGEFFNEFATFDSNGTIPSYHFDVPSECKAAKTSARRNPRLTAPTRPNISNNFFTKVRIEQHSHDATMFGDGAWAIDHIHQKGVEDYYFRIEGHVFPFREFELQRYDLGQIFEIDSENYQECRERQVTGPQPSFWAWIANSTYVGQDVFHGRAIDVWATQYGSSTLEIGTIDPNNDLPVFYRERTLDGEIFIEFDGFMGNASLDQEIFDVPSECQSAKRK